MVEKYHFGSLTHEGETYTSDVFIHGHEVKNWRRIQGHRVEPADLDFVVVEHPAFLLIGTGAQGVMCVPEETQSYLEHEGIHVKACRTDEAIKEYRRLEREGTDVALAAHLTC